MKTPLFLIICAIVPLGCSKRPDGNSERYAQEYAQPSRAETPADAIQVAPDPRSNDQFANPSAAQSGGGSGSLEATQTAPHSQSSDDYAYRTVPRAPTSSPRTAVASSSSGWPQDSASSDTSSSSSAQQQRSFWPPTAVQENRVVEAVRSVNTLPSSSAVADSAPQPSHRLAALNYATHVLQAAEPNRVQAALPGATSNGPEFDDVFAEIDRKLSSLPLGNIAFNTPETIPWGSAKKIELLVSLQDTEQQLRRAVRAPGPVKTARVQLSPKMEATLTGLGFRIEAIRPSQQPISPRERTQWLWMIEPTKSGSLDLTLTLTAFIKIDGQEQTRPVRTFERTIPVDVPITYQVSQFLSHNINWIVPSLLVPLVGAFYHRRRRRRLAQSAAEQLAFGTTQRRV